MRGNERFGRLRRLINVSVAMWTATIGTVYIIEAHLWGIPRPARVIATATPLLGVLMAALANIEVADRKKGIVLLSSCLLAFAVWQAQVRWIESLAWSPSVKVLVFGTTSGLSFALLLQAVVAAADRSN